MRMYLVNGSQAGTKYEIPQEMDSVRLGRETQNDIVLLMDGVSRYHARMFRETGLWYIEDLHSTNGTKVNGNLIRSATIINRGDMISLGGQGIRIGDRVIQNHSKADLSVQQTSQRITNNGSIDTGSAERIVSPNGGLESGMMFAEYRLEYCLGLGGMGEVWRAEQPLLKRKVAIKILFPEFTQNPELVKRFQAEVRTSGKMSHPNIVTALGAGEFNGLQYLVISYICGINLDQKISRNGPVPEAQSLQIIKAVASALNYAWEKHRIIHRDIKPGNIMLDSDNDIKIMDMGISKNLLDLEERSCVTQCGDILGTPHYMSPEQARSENDVDFRADIYSLGVTLFHLVTGDVPYDGPSAMAVIAKHLVEPIPSARAKNINVSENCDAFISMMMQKDRNRRPSSWGEVIKMADSVLAGKKPFLSIRKK